MLRFPFAGTDEADTLTPGIRIENPGDLAHVPQRWLIAIDITIAFHYRPRETLLGYGAEDLFIAVRCAPSDTPLWQVSQSRGAPSERVPPRTFSLVLIVFSSECRCGPESCRLTLSQGRWVLTKSSAKGEGSILRVLTKRCSIVFAVINIQAPPFRGCVWIY